MTDAERILRLESQIEELASAVAPSEPSPEAVASTLRFSPVTRSVIKWTTASFATVFLAGAAYAKFQHDIAFKDDIETHITRDFQPLKSEVGTVGYGVRVLLQERSRNLEITRLQRKIEKHQRNHDELMADYRAALAKGRRAQKPQQNETWIELESELESVLQREAPPPPSLNKP